MLWQLWSINATLNTIFAIVFKEVGWANCAIQLWAMTIVLYINREALENGR